MAGSINSNKFDYQIGCSLKLQFHSISLLLNVNFDKFIIRSHFIHTSFMLAKFSKDQRLLVMSLINRHIVNNIQLVLNLTCVLKE